MAKKRKKKKKKTKRIEDIKRRSATALSALIRSGGGIHKDRRTKRKRTRKDKKRQSISEQTEE